MSELDAGYPDAPTASTASTRLTVVAYTLATRWRRSQHGQHCPVWTGRKRNTTVDTCNCWLLANARHDAAAVLAALDEWTATLNVISDDPHADR